MRRVAITAVALAGSLAPALPAISGATPPRWVSATPGGARMHTIAQSATVPSTLYASTEQGAVFRTIDGGAQWTRVRGFGPCSPVDEFLISPRDPKLVLALSCGLWRSRNGGRAWEPVVSDLFLGVVSVASDPAGSTLYAGTANGVFQSQDGGDHWAAVDGATSGTVLAVAVDPENPTHLFAALNTLDNCPDTTILRSVDRGATWTQVSTQRQYCLRDTPVFVFDRSRAGMVYLLFRDHNGSGPPSAQRSLDGGLTWGPLAHMGWTQDLASGTDGRLYAGTIFGVSTSTDAGATWTPPIETLFSNNPPPHDGIARLLVSSDDNDRIYAAGDSGVWISRRGATAWREANRGITGLEVSAVAATAAGPPAVYASTGFSSWDDFGSSWFRSGDAGQSWTRLHQTLQGPQPDHFLTFDPRDTRRMFGVQFDGTEDQLLRSADGGKSWKLLPVGFTCGGDSICSETMPAFTLDPRDPDSMLLGIYSFVHFQGVSEFLVHSSDGGDTWTDLTPVASLQALAIDPADSSHYWALACDHLFDSGDGGHTWRPTGAGLPSGMCDGGAAVVLAVTPAPAPLAIYAGVSGHGVFESLDGGTTFQRLGPASAGAGLTTLQTDPADPRALYIGATTRGVFRWNPERGRWSALNDGLPIADFLGIVAVDPQQPARLFAATREHGLLRLDLDPTP